MTWSELERFVLEAEADPVMRRSLKHCRSETELLLAARRLGYRLSRGDLIEAREEHRREQKQQGCQAGMPA
ncbi:Nif11-like leader peptide family natural product precursor [Synechococcus sp. CS-1325]|uniref:Nif11-like leader peptide family natural product precursor n=1 Tax=unclassified Synechococcus TaxID=2626047 RepID=UPI000DB1FFC3|nr:MULTISPECIES: Nif11-like leader peptide family natural product precursor [unclassified Synechococcus]PZU96913.1 MAG: nitrogen fixation protein [Cyanobium sp.]MCT0200550.1 Nif11-like leader peptide family natural product precursor [Synechococcus sp. CS-1325]MCT0213492.1 Nif11-like leader peptide family natural product precursor [Synechococcus sp. CS-1326]MCT0229592.1 Nif11-like leader peptide family natural product precursor [Synechococcus sp. CS-1324]MCT0234649.1 Nif11-like leader peptide f